MEVTMNNGEKVYLREYQKKDFATIHQLNKEEEWNNLVRNHEDTKKAWNNSNIAYVATRHDKVIGYVRGFTDQNITTFICEVLIDQNYRGMGLGNKMLYSIHSLYPKTRIDLLGSSTSRTFYEQQGYRAFYGFRKTMAEYGV